jgi:hypothetical protein
MKSVADWAAQSDPDQNHHFRRGRDWPPEQLPKARHRAPLPRPDVIKIAARIAADWRRGRGGR